MAGILNFFKQSITPSYLGVDIGTTSIKVVEMKSGQQRAASVVNYGILESSGYLARANQVLQTSALKLFEKEVVELLKTVLREMKPQATEVIASIPAFSAFLTVLDFPMMSAPDLERAMAYQAKQYVPLPISEIALEWFKVGETKDEKGFVHQQILLVSLPREQVAKYRKIFELAGLRLAALEIEPLAIARIYGGADPTPTIVVDIGSRSTNIAFIEKGALKFNAQSDFAGASLTQALSTSLGINPLRAEELKKERGIVGTGPNYELSTIMFPFVDAIINEVKKAEYKYASQFPEAPRLERVILAGGTANLLGIEKYFEREMGRPVVKGTPFAGFEYPPVMEPLVPELNPVMSVALGLGLREFI
ncbi:MAG TPA: type IV pilus assembly protein PilM [Candidatus Paceibacterota bacterium]|nr:type IV pilus assembly protein PilM [Candidatus Paceibacterota bacterium]